MILNVSGRTDVVAFYSKWFLNRFRAGFIDVRNPFYPTNVSRIFFEDVDAILFCTKNPIPIIDSLSEIKKPILFHVTITPYHKDIEPYVPSKKAIIEAVKRLSSIIGIEHLYIRYDPVFISEKYNVTYHVKAFEKLCSELNGYVKHIIISFLDEYKNVLKNKNILKYCDFSEKDYQIIGKSFFSSAQKNGMTVQTCFEEHDLIEYGFIKENCVSKELIFQLTGKIIQKKWNARKGGKCSCISMVDIGAYNSCKHFCKYCYANFDEGKVKENILKHNDNSSMLLGNIQSGDVIKIRRN